MNAAHTKVNKRHHKVIVSRHRCKASKNGYYWLCELECRHQVKLPDLRGSVAIETHCPKCELGLVRA